MPATSSRGQTSLFHRLLFEHPALLLSALYVAASTIGMLFSWDFLRRFGIDVFLYAEIGDFLLASLREPFTWLIVLASILLMGFDNLLSRHVARRTISRWLRWYASPRYRALNYLAAFVLIVFFIAFYASVRADKVYAGEGEIVTVTLSNGSGSEEAMLLGTTGRFMFLYDRESNRVVIHPHENVVSIVSSVPSGSDRRPSVGAQ